MRVLHELNQLDMGGAERVVLGIVKHDKANEHSVYTYKDGPMRPLLEAAGAKVFVEDKKTEHNLVMDIIHVHTGGEPSNIATSVQGSICTVETVHSPIVSAVREKFVWQRIGVSCVVSKMNRKCTTIYNGVDVDRLETPEDMTPADYKEKLGIPRDAYVIGRMGRLGYDKGVEQFLAACWIIQQQHPDTWILIGGGEASNAKGYLGKIKVMAASFPLKNVVFTGETDDARTVYSAMDLFMYPSATEGFGLVLLEAAASGVAVLTWENAVTRELLLGNAMLVKEHDVEQLAARAIYLRERPSIREEFAQRGQEHVLAHFTEREMSRRYSELYQKLAVENGLDLLNMEPQEAQGAEV
jgi:glycosyltransferase involved in cell wall biosynthesis